MDSKNALVSTSVKRRASGLRFPKLFAIVVVLFVLDLLLPDFVPFIDEIILGLLAVMLGMLRKKVRGENKEESDSRETDQG